MTEGTPSSNRRLTAGLVDLGIIVPSGDYLYVLVNDPVTGTDPWRCKVL